MQSWNNLTFTSYTAGLQTPVNASVNIGYHNNMRTYMYSEAPMIRGSTEATIQETTEHHDKWLNGITKILSKTNEPPETDRITICLATIVLFYILAFLLMILSYFCRSKCYLPTEDEAIDVPPTAPILANNHCESNTEVTHCIDDINSGKQNGQKHNSGENMRVNSYKTLYTTNSEQLDNNNVMDQTTDAHDVPDTGLIAIRNDNVCATFITDDCDTSLSNDTALTSQDTSDDVTNNVRFTAEFLRKVKIVMRKATSGRTHDARQNIITAGLFETEIV